MINFVWQLPLGTIQQKRKAVFFFKRNAVLIGNILKLDPDAEQLLLPCQQIGFICPKMWFIISKTTEYFRCFWELREKVVGRHIKKTKMTRKTLDKKAMIAPVVFGRQRMSSIEFQVTPTDSDLSTKVDNGSDSVIRRCQNSNLSKY